MNTKILLLFILILVSCKKVTSGKLVKSNSVKKEITRPNIIAIVIDDAGYVDFGFMGSKDLETPNIDKLASDGVIFTDAHVSASVCAPSRAGLITGKYQQRFGFEANGTGYGGSGDIGLADNVVTIADVLQNYEYKTIAIGKWHLGGSDSDHPNNRGFDEFYGFIGGGRSYFPLKKPSKNLMLQNNGEREIFDGYLTDVFGDKSVKFVEENQDEPFFMYLAYNAVHTPMEAKTKHLNKYKDHPRQKLAAMTWSLDENIGKLINKLTEIDLLDNTLIYFISDNGGAHNNESENGKLKGWKGNKFEGGHRVPFIVSWPSKIKPKQYFNGLSSSLDIFSTSIAAANIQVEKEMILDGVNLLPYLTGEKTGNPHKDLYWRKLEESGSRHGNYKLISLQDFGSRMYNLSNDIGENHDISKVDSTTFRNMKIGYKQWEKEMMTPLWGEEKSWMEVTYHIHRQLMDNKKALYKSPSDKKDISYQLIRY